MKAIDFLPECCPAVFRFVLVFCLCTWEHQPLGRCRCRGWQCCHLEDGDDWDLSVVTVTCLTFSEYVCVVESTSKIKCKPRFSCYTTFTQCSKGSDVWEVCTASIFRATIWFRWMSRSSSTTSV